MKILNKSLIAVVLATACVTSYAEDNLTGNNPAPAPAQAAPCGCPNANFDKMRTLRFGPGVKPGTIEVEGVGVIKATPDTVTMNFAVSYENPDLATVKNDVEKAVTDFVKVLKGLGIKEKGIIANSISVHPVTEFDHKARKQVKTGFRATRNIVVETDNLSLVDKISESAITNNVNVISTYTYSIKDPKALQKKANQLAIQNAKDQAKELADGFNVELASLDKIEFLNYDDFRPNPYARAKFNNVDAVALNAPALAPATYTVNEIVISSRVSAIYNILPKQPHKPELRGTK